jgi:predicted acylesterase/phospholipase RssA
MMQTRFLTRRSDANGRCGWRSGVVLAVGLALTTVAGCGSIPRREAPLGNPSATHLPGFPDSIRVVGDDLEAYRRWSPATAAALTPHRNGAPVQMLVLSGGGAGGAFGAGALIGWTRTGQRPDFQIVTGVSAGALIAPLAFLGSDWDPQLEAAFAGTATERLLQAHWSGALFGDSVYAGEPLVHLVERFVTDELIAAVARKAAAGGLLLVATTDLDTEQTVLWNLGAIAAVGGPRARTLFRDVLVASASIPGVFPPVLLHVESNGLAYEEMHVDGGTTQPLVLAPDVAAVSPDPLGALGGAVVHVIVNGRFGSLASTTARKTVPILRRSATIALRRTTVQAATVAFGIAARSGMAFRITSIPNDYPFDGPLDLRPEHMRTLFDFGARCVLAGQLWETSLQLLTQRAATRTADSAAATACPAADVDRDATPVTPDTPE